MNEEEMWTKQKQQNTNIKISRKDNALNNFKNQRAHQTKEYLGRYLINRNLNEQDTKFKKLIKSC